MTHPMSEKLRKWANESHPMWSGHPVVMAAADELDRLYAIVERLPKTADGVAVVPGMDCVYRWQAVGGGYIGEFHETAKHLIEASYSTRAAAEAAQKEAGR